MGGGKKTREKAETCGASERKEAEKEGNEGQVSSACQEKEVRISRDRQGKESV